jgi:hypothetical protein
MPSVFLSATVRDFQYVGHQIGMVADYTCAYENEGGELWRASTCHWGKIIFNYKRLFKNFSFGTAS